MRERERGGEEKKEGRRKRRWRDTVLGTMRAAPILFSEIPISHRFSGEKEGRARGVRGGRG